jgi:hypothetical protein
MSVSGDERKEPAVSSLAHRSFTHLGMDVSKNSISVAVLSPATTTRPSTASFMTSHRFVA